MNLQIAIRPFDRSTVLNRFACGRRPIDQWFKNNAKKCTDRLEFRVFTAHVQEVSYPIGYYALQIGNESMDAVENKPDNFTKNYTAFPAVHLAFLGVHEDYQGRGVGTLLMKDIFDKTYQVSKCAGMYALTLQSLDEASTRFYRGLGFTPYSSSETSPKMLIPIRTIVDLVESENHP